MPYVLMAVWVLAFFGALLAASRLVRPARRSPEGSLGYESGERPQGTPWIRMSARFQALLALACLYFIGTLVFYPAAVVFRAWVRDSRGLAAFAALAVFLGSFAVALAHAWKKGDLSWVRGDDGSP